MAESDRLTAPVLHVLVIGFHHKKGCQVEYSYPPLIEGNNVDSNEVPPEWKHLPSLAIPDGAHNYMEDTIFFHLPARGDKLETVYGVSCYRQMDATELRNRGSEVTRNSVQKSVCVLSRLPLYGLIQAKLELITHAYFDERDFTQVALLEDTYKNLNASLKQSLLDGSQVFLGLSSREIVQCFKHRLLVLFKLMLLERRVLFFGSPVKPICTAMLSILSLFPRLIEYGLQESASYSPTRQLSPTLKITRLNSTTDEANEYLEVHYTETPTSTDIKHAEKEESTATKVSITNRNLSSSSAESQTGSSKRDHKKAKASPGHPVKVSDVKAMSAPVESSSHDFPGIHRQCSRDSQGSTSADTIDHPLSATYTQSSPSEHPTHSRSRQNSGSKKDKDKDNFERKLEHAATTIDRITHLEPVQDSYTTQGDEAILGVSPKDAKASKKDPLEFVHEITKVSSVQKHIQRLSSSGRSGSLPDEDLTPDEKELLGDTDECAFSWQEDKLLLEISEDAESPDVFGASPTERSRVRMSSGSDRKQNSSDDSSTLLSPEDPDDEGVTRSHNLDLEADLFSDLGQGQSERAEEASGSNEGSKGKSRSLRNKLSAAWSSNKDANIMNVELTEIRPVTPSSLNVDEFGFPISIFTKGMLCHPYLSLQFYDLLQDVNVRGFTIGATNVLYKQKRHLLDAVVEVTDEGKVEIHDPELRKQVNLTTADLRFADYLVKATLTEGEKDLYLDDTSWEGGDEWLRGQFRHYMLSLLAASQSSDEKVQEDFNLSFLAAWKATHNYKLWYSTRHHGMVDMAPTHPYHGQVTMADMKLKLAHSLSNTERGKKVNAAMASTGKAVLQTGKVVGGALTSARTAVSSWFSSWRQPSTDQSPESPVDDDKHPEFDGDLVTEEDGSPSTNDLIDAKISVADSSEEEVFVQEGTFVEKNIEKEKLHQDAGVCNGTTCSVRQETHVEGKETGSGEKGDLPQVAEKLDEEMERS